MSSGKNLRRWPVALWYTVLCCTLVGQSCRQSDEEQLLIFSALGFRNVLYDIQNQYQAEHPPVRIDIHCAASGVLQRQIERGAPCDIFISAAQLQMDALAEKQLLLNTTRSVLAFNRLVFIKRRSGNQRIGSILEGLEDSSALIAVGNPKTVPAGQYAQAALLQLRKWEDVNDRLIFAEHVRHVLEYVTRGETAYGFVYRSDSLVFPDRVEIVETVPTELSGPVAFHGAVLKQSDSQMRAQQFLRYLSDRDNGHIFKQHGFDPVECVQ